MLLVFQSQSLCTVFLELYNGYKTFLDELYLSTCSKEDRLKEEMKIKRKKDKFEEKRRMKDKES